MEGVLYLVHKLMEAHLNVEVFPLLLILILTILFTQIYWLPELMGITIIAS